MMTTSIGGQKPVYHRTRDKFFVDIGRCRLVIPITPEMDIQKVEVRLQYEDRDDLSATARLGYLEMLEARHRGQSRR